MPFRSLNIIIKSRLSSIVLIGVGNGELHLKVLGQMHQMRIIFLDSGRHLMKYLGVNDKELSLLEGL